MVDLPANQAINLLLIDALGSGGGGKNVVRGWLDPPGHRGEHGQGIFCALMVL